MINEDKDILLKDLCARLPYNLMVEYKGETYDVLGIAHGRVVLCKPFMSYTLDEHPLVKEVKPYLFPLSSMTSEQKKEYAHLLAYTSNVDMIQIIGESTYDWLNKNMFDWRGLIPKGLAKDATGLQLY